MTDTTFIRLKPVLPFAVRKPCLVLWLMASIVLWACASLAAVPAPVAKQRKDSVVVVRLAQDPSSLDPYADALPGSNLVCAAIFDALFEVNDKWELQPELASRVPAFGAGMSKDGLVYRIPLRARVKWHDGQGFSSGDVKYTLDKVVGPRAGSLGYRGFEKVASVEAPDPQTVVIRLREPWAGLTAALAGVYILPEHILARYADGVPASFGRSPIGTGAFALDEWRQGSVKLKAWDSFYRGRPRVDSLVFRTVADEKVALAQLEKGDLGVVSGLSPRTAHQLEASPSVRVVEASTPTFEHLLFNQLNPVLADKRVRRAISAVVPIDFIRAEVYFGLWHSAVSPSVSPARNAALRAAVYDPDRARKLLEEAGWKAGPDGVRVKGGKRLVLDLSSTSGNKQREQVLELLRDEGRKVGIEFTLKLHPSSRFFASPDEGGIVDGGLFDIALFGVLGGVEPDLYRMFHSTMVPPNGTNAGHFRSAKLDGLLEAWANEIDPKQRAEAYGAVLSVMADDLPIIPTFYWARVDACADRVRNVKPAGTTAGLLWNVWEWYVVIPRAADEAAAGSHPD